MTTRLRTAALWDPLIAALAVAAYAPLFWSSPGRVSADTKSYLYLHPGELLAKAPWLWDSGTGLGTVSHQTIGYLFPMGPWFWFAETIGLPDWVAQRLWLGTLFFAAGTGVVALARQLRLPWRAAAVAAVVYQLSPYVLPYAARLSAILLPWAGLGWLLAFTHRSLRELSWRWPAATALVVLAVGSVNATALVLVGLGPVCLVAWAAWSDRSIGPRRALGATVRIGALCLVVSAWWIAGLWAQSRYGLPILRYTETYEAVARASSPAEVLRGLGYWFGYGRDAVSPWVEPVPPYAHAPVLVVVTFAVPALALASLALTRWRARGLAVLLVVVGAVVSVGAHPYASPSVAGRLLRWFVATDVGRALRSTPRAVPLVVLGLALGLGMGVEVLAARRPKLRVAAPTLVVGLVAAGLPALWTGRIYTSSLLRADPVPQPWLDVADALDQGDPAARVLEVPGSDFASFRWGGTVDPVLAGLTTRDVAARELVPWGGPASADLLAALDRRWQDRIVEPAAVAPLLRRLGVGDVVLRGDLQYERYRLARPRQLNATLAGTPGLVPGAAFGAPVANEPAAEVPLLDAETLTTPRAAADPAPVSLWRVGEPRPVVRAEAERTTIVAGDGEGLVDLAAIGGLDGAGIVRYAASFASDGTARDAARDAALDAVLAAGAAVVVTDTNRRQARRWGSVREYLGAVEAAGEEPLRDDPTDNRLELFPGASDASFTTAVVRGAARVQATSYGNPITYTPEDRAVMAFDGDARTAWRVGAFSEVRGERLEIDLESPVTTDRLTFLQPLDGPRNRWITGVRLRFDGKDPLDVRLDEASRAAPGQVVTIGVHTFTSLSIEIVDANYTRLPGYKGISAVGFAEVSVAGARATEWVRLPSDVLGRVTDQPLTAVLTRQHASALDVNRADPEPALRRVFTLPTARTFTLSGSGALSPRASDALVVAQLAPAGARAVASARLAGDTAGTGLAAIDDDDATAWRTPHDAPLQTLRIDVPAAVTIDRLDLALVADGRHSVPTRLTIVADGGTPASIDVPPMADASASGAVARAAIVLPTSVTGRTIEVRVDAVREVRSVDADSGAAVVQPVGIAELGLAGVQASPLGRAELACRDDLVRVDGQPLPIRVVRVGTVLTIDACGALDLAAGEHTVETVAGRDTGLDIDRLVLTSAPAAPVAAAPPAPALTTTRTSRISYRVAVRDAVSGSFWLVLGESHNAGWRARVGGRDLGPPTLVDGYANGWLIQPSGAELTVELRWTPQRVIWRAMALSGAGVVTCLALVVLGGRRRVAHPLAATARASAPGPSEPRSVPVASVLAALGALVCSGWLAALLVGAVRIAQLSMPGRWMRRAHVVPAVLMAAVAAYVVAKQARYDLPTDLDWPAAFAPVQPLAWAAVFLTVPRYRSRRAPATTAQPPLREPMAKDAEPEPTTPAAALDPGPPQPQPRARTWPPGLRDRP